MIERNINFQKFSRKDAKIAKKSTRFMTVKVNRTLGKYLLEVVGGLTLALTLGLFVHSQIVANNKRKLERAIFDRDINGFRKFIPTVNVNDVLEPIGGFPPLVLAVLSEAYDKNGGNDNGVEIIRYLLDHSANVNQPAEIQMTALGSAAASGRPDLCQLLLAHGADVNAHANAGGSYPIHEAAFVGGFSPKQPRNPRVDYEKTVSVLLEAGADINCKNSAGETPLQVAKKYNHEKMADFLSNIAAKQH